MDVRSRLFFLPIAAFAVVLGLAVVGFFVFFGGVPVKVPTPPYPPPMAPTVADPLPPTPVTAAAPTSTSVVAPSPDPKPNRASLLFVGDIMLDRNVRLRSLEAGTRGYPFAKLPPGWFDAADYAVANLEGPVTALRRPPEKSIDRKSVV